MFVFDCLACPGVIKSMYFVKCGLLERILNTPFSPELEYKSVGPGSCRQPITAFPGSINFKSKLISNTSLVFITHK